MPHGITSMQCLKAELLETVAWWLPGTGGDCLNPLLGHLAAQPSLALDKDTHTLLDYSEQAFSPLILESICNSGRVGKQENPIQRKEFSHWDQ